MEKIKGKLVKIDELSNDNILDMFNLMDTFYENMNFSIFKKDLTNKDFCIILLDEKSYIQGFSTQKIMHIPVNGMKIHGVFSGDTIIHKDYWGSLELYKVFSQYFFEYGTKFSEFYWFLISKGYKTYKILTTFFKEFYPNYKEDTPRDILEIINGFGKYAYLDEFNEKTGIIEYKTNKDKLKEGVADITKKQEKDKNIAFFKSKNPGYVNGNDLVCVTSLRKDNLHSLAQRLLF